MRGFKRTALTLNQAHNQQVGKLINHRLLPARSLKTGAPDAKSSSTSSILTSTSGGGGGKSQLFSQTNKRQQSTTRTNYLASSQVKPSIRTAPVVVNEQLELDECVQTSKSTCDVNSHESGDTGSNLPGNLLGESLRAQITCGQDKFVNRHVGPKEEDLQVMLATLGYSSLDELISETVPAEIRLNRPLNLPAALSEHELIEQLKELANQNESTQWKSFIGLGYYDCIVPPVILRNIFENPGWTTAYTAYQAEIAQGRLESLMNFQTMISDLTGLDVANASLLDESTAVAEAMQVCYRVDRLKRNKFLMSTRCHPQTRAVVETRAAGLGIEIDYFDELELLSSSSSAAATAGGAGNTPKVNFAQYCCVLVQYPNSDGHLFDLDQITGPAQEAKCLVAVATDLMACTLFKPPGDYEHPADLVVGSAQRFGVPLNYGGPHAGFLACKQKLIRSIPGRVVGVTRDSNGQQAYRFALQTREQHIRRDKATSNICTAQALLANMSAMYAIYHGPAGLKSVANAIHLKTSLLAHLLAKQQTVDIVNEGSYFDTLTLELPGGERQLRQVQARAHEAKINLCYHERAGANERPSVAIALDETTNLLHVFKLANLFQVDREESYDATSSTKSGSPPPRPSELETSKLRVPLTGDLKHLARKSAYLTHPTFNRYHSEAQLVRYMKSLENKDISLAHSMIPLGSCTMKLNATSQMLASSWPEFAQCHPFQPVEQTLGYQKLFENLNDYLCEITGYDRISFQPNSGAQGEYAGLRVIRAYLDARGETKRNLCLIPISAHGTNPASAQMAGFQIQQVKVLENGNIDREDFEMKVEENRDRLACFMITYPSTFGVFEENIREMCSLVHEAGGQVYLDGANMNAQVGLCRPGDYGSDVSHLNLHKTFCIPHGGGGPGAGPIGVKSHLVPYLPTHPLVETPGGLNQTNSSFGTISSGMWGSPAILPISWSYIRLMSQDLKRSSEVAILNANYMRKRLEQDYKILYRGSSGNVAHEFILDCRPFKKSTNIEANDIAKRLQDFGLHAPTVSWPVGNTLMLEPTESEDKRQLDDYCDALLQIRREIARIESGDWDQEMNPIKQAPHTQQVVCSSNWTRPYTREQAAFPAPFVKSTNKIWPTVGRVDDTYGDTNLFCSCPPVPGATSEAHAT